MTSTPTTCDQCGQTDTDPKVHLSFLNGDQDITKHNDCLSVRERETVSSSDPIAAKVIEACLAGAKGEDLLAKIQELHKPAKGKK